MYFPTLTVSKMALTMSITLLFLTAFTSAAPILTPSACNRCIEEKMISSEPACANLPTSINLSKFNGDFLTPQHRKCYYSIPSDKVWYMSCSAIDKCSDEDMDEYNFFFKIIASAGGSAGAPAGNSTAGGIIKSEVGSGKAFSTAAAGVAAAAVLFTVLL